MIATKMTRSVKPMWPKCLDVLSEGQWTLEVCSSSPHLLTVSSIMFSLTLNAYSTRLTAIVYQSEHSSDADFTSKRFHIPLFKAEEH